MHTDQGDVMRLEPRFEQTPLLRSPFTMDQTSPPTNTRAPPSHQQAPAIVVAVASPSPTNVRSFNPYGALNADRLPSNIDTAAQFRQRPSPPTSDLGSRYHHQLQPGQTKPSYGSSSEIFGQAGVTSRSPSPTINPTYSNRDSRVPLVSGARSTMNTGSIRGSTSASTVRKFGVTVQARNWQLLLSYAPDWLLTVGLTAAFYLLDGIEGFRREFDLNDSSIQHSYAEHERVPNWMLLAICAGGPVLVMPILNFLTVRKWWDYHNSMLGCVLSLGMTGTITNVVKILTGRPRPDLIARCMPSPGSQNSPVFGLATSAICTRTDHLKDGFRSFPSGHSSLSFAGLGFLSFYLAGKLHLWDERGHTGKAWLSVTPLVGAALVAVSRTADYRHHWQDVTVGGMLGIIIAYFAYRQYYPPLTHPLSHQPYSPRIPREKESSILPVRQDSTDSAYRAPMSAPLNHTTQLRQFSTPVNPTPYEPRVYASEGPQVFGSQPTSYGQYGSSSPYRDATTLEAGPGDEHDMTLYGRTRSSSPEEGAGADGTVPRPQAI